MASARPRCGRSACHSGTSHLRKRSIAGVPQRHTCADAQRIVVHLAQGDPKMRIAQVAPLTEAVPPRLYGGTERVVHWLTEELVALGHDVTLFASGDSKTSA